MRWYDASVDRWSQGSQMNQAGDLKDGNRYLYVGDNPVNATDPSGAATAGGRCIQGEAPYRPAACRRAGGLATACLYDASLEASKIGSGD
jgi:hypothetical protein